MRKPSRTLSAKDIKVGIKNGFTVKDFCTKFNIRGGETSFLEQLERAYPHGGSDQILREIRKNEKRGRVRTVNHRKGGMQMQEKALSKIEVLKSQEADLSAAVIKLETEHKALASEHRNYLKQAREIETKVDKLMAEVKTCSEQFEKIIETNNNIVRKMNAVSEDRAKKLTAMDMVRVEIENLTVVSIGVCNNCAFEMFDNDFNIDLSGKEEQINKLTHQLMDQEICEDLTAKQIRTLSKLIIIRSNSPRKVEFVFDGELGLLEKAYTTYLASYQPLSS